MYQNVPQSFNELITIICISFSDVSTCVRVIMFASSAEPDPGVTRVAISVLVSKDTDSCFGACGTLCVEAFPVTGA